jgi:coenzyme F420-0:L-glutamate ligase / coenzyme F420-1:gamma-L-glutamate ligase
MNTEAKFGLAIDQRRSIRRYLPGQIDESTIERILIAATQAPSAHHRQPWRFAVLDDPTDKVKLATAMGEQLRKDRTADGEDPKAIEDDVARSYARITEAPVVIVACLDDRDMDRYPDGKRNTAEYLMAVQSTAMAVQNLLLAAHCEGLGACVMCAPLFCSDSVSQGLSLPSEWRPQMLVTIGTPANAGRIRPRLPLAQVVRWSRRKGNPDSAR